MTTWTAGDGTKVTLEGDDLTVVGTSPLALKLRNKLRSSYVGVAIAAPPGGCVPLVRSDAWLVDRWVRGHAHPLDVASTYVANDADAPMDARRLLARAPDDWSPDIVF